MQQQLLNDDGSRTWAVILDTGDEVTSCLLEFASLQRLSAAHLTAIGAFEHATLGYFDWQQKDYRRIPVETQAEVVSLIGDVARSGDEPKLHMHAALGLPDGTMCGGHVLEGVVRPTLEVIVTETPSWLQRRHDPETGLALIRPLGDQAEMSSTAGSIRLGGIAASCVRTMYSMFSTASSSPTK